MKVTQQMVRNGTIRKKANGKERELDNEECSIYDKSED